MVKEIHETKARLIQVTADLLGEMPHEDISAALVLEKTGISKGSLYHFFDDWADLLDAAYIQRYIIAVRASADVIDRIVAECNTREEFFAGMDKVTAATQKRDNAGIRFERARMLGRTERSERFRTELGEVQQEMTDRLAASFGIAQQRGWIRSDFSSRTIAVFIQAYTLGRIVDDITETTMDDAEWNALIGAIAREVF